MTSHLQIRVSTSGLAQNVSTSTSGCGRNKLGASPSHKPVVVGVDGRSRLLHSGLFRVLGTEVPGFVRFAFVQGSFRYAGGFKGAGSLAFWFGSCEVASPSKPKPA